VIRDGVVVVERRVRAPRAEVYSYLTNATRWAVWQGIAAEIDASPGGSLAVTMPNGDVAAGTFVELVQDQRVVFTWGWSGHPVIPPGSSTVEIELIDDDEGTLVRLSHRDLPLDATDLHDAGWIRYIERLGAVARGLPIGADAIADP